MRRVVGCVVCVVVENVGSGGVGLIVIKVREFIKKLVFFLLEIGFFCCW